MSMTFCPKAPPLKVIFPADSVGGITGGPAVALGTALDVTAVHVRLVLTARRRVERPVVELRGHGRHVARVAFERDLHGVDGADPAGARVAGIGGLAAGRGATGVGTALHRRVVVDRSVHAEIGGRRVVADTMQQGQGHRTEEAQEHRSHVSDASTPRNARSSAAARAPSTQTKTPRSPRGLRGASCTYRCTVVTACFRSRRGCGRGGRRPRTSLRPWGARPRGTPW